MRKTAIAAMIGAAALTLTACSTSTEPQPSVSTPTSVTGALTPDGSGDPYKDMKAAADQSVSLAGTISQGVSTEKNMEGDSTSPASELRAKLTADLQEYSYLSGFLAAEAVYSDSTDTYNQAVQALESNTSELEDLIGSLNADQKDAFSKLWQDHNTYFLDYTKAKANGDDGAAQAALENLTTYTQDAGGFFEQLSNQQLAAADVSAALKTHTETLTGAVDAMVSGGEAGSILKTAADQAVMLAGTLASGLAGSVEGDSASPASELRSQLTGELQAHVYLTGWAVRTSYQDGMESASETEAQNALSDNTAALASTIGSVSDSEQEASFRQLWEQHLTHLMDYAKAVAADDLTNQQAALDGLTGYTGGASIFFETLTNGQLAANDLENALTEHIKKMTGMIDSFAKGSMLAKPTTDVNMSPSESADTSESMTTEPSESADTTESMTPEPSGS